MQWSTQAFPRQRAFHAPLPLLAGFWLAGASVGGGSPVHHAGRSAISVLRTSAPRSLHLGTGELPSVLVTPENGALVTTSSFTLVALWCDADDAIVRHDMTWQGALLPDTYVAETRAGCVAAGRSTWRVSIEPWAGTAVATAVDAAGHRRTVTTNVRYAPPMRSFAPAVSPRPGFHSVRANVAAADTFTIRNAGTYIATYAVSAACGSLANCVVSRSLVTLTPGARASAVVSYSSPSSPGAPQQVKLVARFTAPTGHVIADTGGVRVVVPASEVAPQVAMTPKTATVPQGSVALRSVTVTNRGSEPVQYSLSFAATNGFLYREAPPDTLTVRPGEARSITVVTKAPGAAGVVGVYTVTASYVAASGATLSGSVADTVRTTNEIATGFGVKVDRKADQAPKYANHEFPVSFTITNSGNVPSAFRYEAHASGDALASCDRAAGTTASLEPFTSVTISFNCRTVNVYPRSGRVILAAASVNQPSVADTGSMMVMTAAGSGISVDVNSMNPGSARMLDQCLKVAVGEDASYECGHWRLVHALPSTTTMGHTYTPRLTRASAMGQVSADVTLDPGVQATSLSMVLISSDGYRTPVSIPREIPWDPAWSDGSPRRISTWFLPSDFGISNGTASRHFTLEVTASTPTGTYTATDTSTLVVVNRAWEAFAWGWWLQGVELLSFNTLSPLEILWVGGDESTRLYTRVDSTADSTIWVVRPAVDRPDTMIYKRLSDQYERHLRNGTIVQFNGVGRHVATINRLGHRTTLTWDPADMRRLQTISLPVPAGSPPRVYTFYYHRDSTEYSWSPGHLDSVIAPSVGGVARRTVVTERVGYTPTIASITDPDGSSISYDYHQQWGMLMGRTDRNGHRTNFQYDYWSNAATVATIEMGGPGLDIVHTFCAAEVVTAEPCEPNPIDPAKVRTQVDGPRTDVADTTAFYLTRWGGPSKIVNALGDSTVIKRENLRWPALATLVVQPNGHRVSMTYDTLRALPITTTDSVPYGDTLNATRTYTWHSKWDEVTQITSPTGLITMMAYDNTNGDRLWQQVGTSSSRRTTFGYDSTTRLLASVAPPSPLGTTSYEHDGFGNLSAVVSSLGFRTETHRDDIGRDTLTKTQIQAAVSTARDWKWQRRHYKVVDLVDQATDSAWSTAENLWHTLSVANVYDNQGNLTTVSRSVAPDPNGIQTATTAFFYDNAGRKVAELSPDAKWDSTAYDPAGNVVRRRPRTGSADAVTMVYDPLNRLTTRTTPGRVFGPDSNVFNFDWANFPRFGASVTIPADVAHFTYDAVGNLLTATNGAAQISRTYYPNSLVRSDTLHIRTYADSDFSRHVYALGFQYDLEGRRAVLTRDQGEVLYRYATSAGEPDTLIMATGGRFIFEYNLAGGPARTVKPDSNSEVFDYDTDGRQIRRTEGSGLYYWMHIDSMAYDPEGKRTRLHTIFDTVATAYTGLGAVASSYRWNFLADATYDERFQPDPLGNLHEKRDNAMVDLFFYQAGTGRLTATQRGGLSTASVYDEAGNQTHFGRLDALPNTQYTASVTRSYYGADQTLRVVDRVANPTAIENAAITVDQLAVFEEYRYDALGRRVLKRSRGCPNTCVSAIERYVWDGDQLLQEIRYPGRDGISTDSLEVDNGFVYQVIDRRQTPEDPPQIDTVYSTYYGTVTYTHGGGLDRPLAIERLWYGQDVYRIGFVPAVLHYDANAGAVDVVTNMAGWELATQGFWVDWPATDLRVYGDHRQHGQARSWFGGLIDQMRDASGFLYKRNRYYDPETGRFTQEDPIGLAGGMNLYGFAAGDPVNYSDPFGLCPPKDDNKEDCRSKMQKVGDFAAGFGDFVSFGATKAIRERLLDCSDCVDYKSGAYTAGEVTGGVVGVAEGGLGAARAAGWTSRVAVHEAHHAFPVIGKAAHVQVNMWQIGTKGSGFTLLRIPLPWR